jgi:hypothetical protein
MICLFLYFYQGHGTAVVRDSYLLQDRMADRDLILGVIGNSTSSPSKVEKVEAPTRRPTRDAVIHSGLANIGTYLFIYIVT